MASDGHRGQSTREPVQVADLAIDGGPAEVLEQVVVDVHAVEGGRCRLHLVAPGQVVSRKVREGLSRSHALARTRVVAGGPPWPNLPMYNTFRAPPAGARTFVRRGDPHRQPGGHHAAGAAGAARGPRDCRRGHPPHRQAARPRRHRDADGQPARPQRGGPAARRCSSGSGPANPWRWSPTPALPCCPTPATSSIRAALDEGIAVEPVPGASAVLAALTMSGVPASQFTFLGFPPVKQGPRRRWCEEAAAYQHPVVFFEAPHRIRQTLEMLGETAGPSRARRRLPRDHQEARGARPRAARRGGRRTRRFSSPMGEFTCILEAPDAVDAVVSTGDEADLVNEFDRITRKWHVRATRSDERGGAALPRAHPRRVRRARTAQGSGGRVVTDCRRAPRGHPRRRTRASGWARRLPKVLLPLAGLPLLEWVLRSASTLGADPHDAQF